MSAAPDDIDATPERAVPLHAYSVVTQPGAVKVIHRSGRVAITFAGPTMREDVRSLIAQLEAVVGDEKRMQREVEMVKRKWWRFGW